VPPGGNPTCTLVGRLKISPGVTPTPSLKKTSLTFESTFGAQLTKEDQTSGVCTGFGSVPSKYPISGGSVKVTVQFNPGSSCSALVNGTPIKSKISVMWMGVNPKNGKLSTVGSDSTPLASITEKANPRTYDMTGVPFAKSKSLFLNKTIDLHFVIDQTEAEIAGLCNTPKKGAQQLNYTAVNGPSNLTIH
jgi:hypothetical protein